MTTIEKVQQKITPLYILVCCIAVFLSFFFHELSHWLAGELLGFKMALQLNLAYPVSANVNDATFNQLVIITAAGPLFTLIQAIVFFFVMKKRDSNLLYPFLFVPFYMRLLAAVISFKNLNDEANISKEIGIGAFTLPLLMCAILFYLVAETTKQKRYSAKFFLLTLVFTLLASSALILADMYFKIRII